MFSNHQKNHLVKPREKKPLFNFCETISLLNLVPTHASICKTTIRVIWLGVKKNESIKATIDGILTQ